MFIMNPVYFSVILLFRKNLFFKYKNIIEPEELFSQLCLLIVNFCLKSYTFCLYLILYLHVWIRAALGIRIRIYKAPE